MTATASNWDPSAAEKEWYSHSVNGDRGWKVLRNGKWFVRLDRPQQVIEKPFGGDWVVDSERRPLTRFAITQVAFEADRLLCKGLGLHGRGDKDWLSLTQDQRMMWMESGPSIPDERARLYKAIMDCLRPLAK